MFERIGLGELCMHRFARNLNKFDNMFARIRLSELYIVIRHDSFLCRIGDITFEQSICLSE